MSAVTTALEALQWLETQRHQSLVCNLRLPDLDGSRCLQPVRSVTDLVVSRLPALAVTTQPLAPSIQV